MPSNSTGNIATISDGLCEIVLIFLLPGANQGTVIPDHYIKYKTSILPFALINSPLSFHLVNRRDQHPEVGKRRKGYVRRPLLRRLGLPSRSAASEGATYRSHHRRHGPQTSATIL